MTRNGTLIICVQNLDFSGANQVVLNILQGRTHESNVIILSPKLGTFASRFIESGASIRIGSMSSLLVDIRDIFCVICNTIMTADIVVQLSQKPFPVLWIIHEWWDDEMIIENFKMRHIESLTLGTVKEALKCASTVVFVCEKQRELYKPTAPSTVIFVGVPPPLPPKFCVENVPGFIEETPCKTSDFTILVLGIICPRKNQIMSVELFKEFARDKKNVRMLIVGARYTREYEINYIRQLQEAIGDDSRIELLPVTDTVDKFYEAADCLLLTSLNEVTPMVISEAMSWGIPVLSTNIAGIPEMFDDSVEGFLFSPSDHERGVSCLNDVYYDPDLRQRMGEAGKRRFESVFDLDLMVHKYRQLLFHCSPPIVLVDMDGCLVDWDAGFFREWKNRSPVDRTLSYYIADCIPDQSYREEAKSVYLSKGFFENLPPSVGALRAIQEMENEGILVYICTTPILESEYCTQEKINWVRKHLGEHFVHRMIITFDKSNTRGDLLIDDKPLPLLVPQGESACLWRYVVFDAPYNRNERTSPRLRDWSSWMQVVLPLLGAVPPATESSCRNAELVIQKQDILRYKNLKRCIKHSEARAKFDRLLNIPRESISVEDVASIAGSGAFFLENGIEESKGNDPERASTSSSGLSNSEALERAEYLNLIDQESFNGVQVFRNSYRLWRKKGKEQFHINLLQSATHPETEEKFEESCSGAKTIVPFSTRPIAGKYPIEYLSVLERSDPFSIRHQREKE